MSRIVVRTVAESRRAPAALLQIRCPNGGRGFYYTRCGVTVSVRCGVTVSVRRGVGAASRGRSACSATCRCPFLMLRIGPEGRSASEVSCRRSFRAVPASVPLPPRPAGGLSRIGPEGRSASWRPLSGDRSPAPRAPQRIATTFPRGGGPAMTFFIRKSFVLSILISKFAPLFRKLKQ